MLYTPELCCHLEPVWQLLNQSEEHHQYYMIFQIKMEYVCWQTMKKETFTVNHCILVESNNACQHACIFGYNGLQISNIGPIIFYSVFFLLFFF